MTRIKVVNTLTNSTYYLNNVDVSCAKLHSYIGETNNKRKILHKPLAHLEYSTDYSYKTDVNELNNLYTHKLSKDYVGYFPSGHGIIISILNFGGSMGHVLDKYVTNRINCENLSLTEPTSRATTYWCPPVIPRIYKNNNIQDTRVISFSYIHKNWYESIFDETTTGPNIYIIYNNNKLSNVNSDKLFAIYPKDAGSVGCIPKYYCPSGAIGVCSSLDDNGQTLTDNSCINTCTADKYISPPCKNYKDFSNTISNIDLKLYSYNELLIKSWNYNPDSNMSDRGIIYDASMDKWVAQTPNPKSPWGWNDVSNLSKNENIPLLAFGISIPDVSNPTKDDISNIKHYYADLSNNLEPSFNEYRRNNGYPLMPYHIGLDVSCLTRPDCSNPFFDLSLILNLAPPL